MLGLIKEAAVWFCVIVGAAVLTYFAFEAFGPVVRSIVAALQQGAPE